MSSLTPTTDQFLSVVAGLIRERNGFQLQQLLPIEPPFANEYSQMINEIQTFFPPGQEKKLENKCIGFLPEVTEGVDGAPWSAFIHFMVAYLGFIRSVDPSNLLETYNSLSNLVQKANQALNHLHLGLVILQTVISYSRVLARLAIGLDRRPELIAHLIERNTQDEGSEATTLPEKAANILRSAFVTCLNDRTGPPSGIENGRPAGKKVGIYKIANLCLKILFQCKKSRNAEQIFTNIYQYSPPLTAFPKSERVTYLYYLGRFHFSMNHFYRAVLALQQAYDECPASQEVCLKQKRLILVYLVAGSIILGRFPTNYLYARPEAKGFKQRFQPICEAIKQGDITTFRHLTAMDSEHANWFLYFRILLQIQNRCEVLVWRSLARRTFMIAGNMGDPKNKRAPTLELADLVTVSSYLEKRALGMQDGGGIPGKRHTNWILQQPTVPKSALYKDPDFEGVEELDEGYGSTQGELKFVKESILPDMLEIESIMSSLIEQGFLNGFISHKLKKFGIQGARQKGALQAGFPNVWEVVKGRNSDEVPGWKKETAPTGQSLGPGMVVNLTGARPVGSF